MTWNAALFYERAPIELRLAARSVGQNLFSFGSLEGNSTDVSSRHRLTMDLGSSYTISHVVKVYFDAKNLLNTPLEFTEGRSDSRPIQREFYNITLLAVYIENKSRGMANEDSVHADPCCCRRC